MKERLTSARLKKLHGHRVLFGDTHEQQGMAACGVLVGYDDATVTVLEKGVRQVERRSRIGTWDDLDDPANESLDRAMRRAGYDDESLD